MAADATHQAVIFIPQISCGLEEGKKESLANNKIIIRIIIKKEEAEFN